MTFRMPPHPRYGGATKNIYVLWRPSVEASKGPPGARVNECWRGNGGPEGPPLGPFGEGVREDPPSGNEVD